MQCGKHIGPGTVNYPCVVEVGANGQHDGPCAADELPRTMEDRWRFERDPDAWRRGRVEAARAREDAFKPPEPKRFWDGAPEQGTPVPGSSLQPEEYRNYRPESASPPPRGTSSEELREWAKRSVVQAASSPRPSVDDAPVLDTSVEAKRQPPPFVNERPPVQEQVLSDIRERMEHGIAKYGTPLQSFNGRNGLRDAYEELLDLVNYISQVLSERSEMLAVALSVKEEVDHQGLDHLIRWLSGV